MKANIKLPFWLGLVAIIISVLFSALSFNILIIIIYVGTLYLIIYFTLGYIRRKDAMIIDNEFVKVRTPFKYTEWKLSDLKKVYLVDNGSMLKGIIMIEDESTEVTLCYNIYDKSLSEIMKTIIENHPILNRY